MPRLIVVSGEPSTLHSLEQGLRSEALTVLTACTIERAVELVRGQRPDAALLDLPLPATPGLDAFDRIRQADPRLPVILMTAFGSTELVIEATKRGAFEYLLKP